MDIINAAQEIGMKNITITYSTSLQIRYQYDSAKICFLTKRTHLGQWSLLALRALKFYIVLGMK